MFILDQNSEHLALLFMKFQLENIHSSCNAKSFRE